MDHRIAATPVISLLFRQSKAIPIAPAREDKATMEAAFLRIREELAAGELVCIFPEGTLTRDGKIAPFRPGVERIVAESGVPVVPLALSGLWESMWSRKDGGPFRWPRRLRARVRLEFAAPIPAAEVKAARIEDEVRRLLGEPRPAPESTV
jgi:1-acyl-sn-glycerol-3-phosphate acyltransferase